MPRTRPGLSVPDALSLARQIAEALEAAHEKGIIHRDLKPANLFIQADERLPGGRLKVCDFGLARDLTSSSRLTRAGDVFGTPAYMAPEQWSTAAVGPSADLYAVGCILYVGVVMLGSGSLKDLSLALFVGSSVAIKATGPAVIISYTLTGTLLLLVMRMLGEMAVEMPQVRSFTEFTRAALGHWPDLADAACRRVHKQRLAGGQPRPDARRQGLASATVTATTWVPPV